MSVQTALYGNLNSANSEIRLLQVSLSVNDEITCDMSTVSLNDHPKFAALSYVWGDPSVTEDIVVNHQKLAVTTNLAAALRRTPRVWPSQFPEEEPKSFRLWVDAICIDQQNLPERSQQVLLMRSIYKAATVVYAWLGEGPEDCNLPLAFQTIEIIYQNITRLGDSQRLNLDWTQRYPALYEHERTNDVSSFGNHVWRNLARLANMPYWSRVWILQECLLAGYLLLLCSTEGIEFAMVDTVVDWLKDVGEAARLGVLHRPGFFPQETFTTLAADHCGHMSTVASFRLIVPRQDVVEPANWTLSIHGKDYQATDPRDHVYGLASVANIGIVPDYTKTVAEVYCDYVSLWLEYWKNGGRLVYPFDTDLWFLPLGGISRRLHEGHMPSWAPNYPSLARRDQRDSGIHIVGRAGNGVFGEHVESCDLIGSSLAVTGFEIDKVVRLHEASDISERCLLEYFGEYQERRSYPSDFPFFRVISTLYLSDILEPLAVKSPRQQGVSQSLGSEFKIQPLIYYGLAFLLRVCYLQWHRDSTTSQQERNWGDSIVETMFFLGLELDRSDSDVDVAREILFFLRENFHQEGDNDDDHNDSGDDFPAVAAVILPQLSAFLNGNRFGLHDADFYPTYISVGASLAKTGKQVLFETSGGRLGLARSGVRQGDGVCLLSGCTVPLILRREGLHHVNVGPTNVIGIMDGEGAELLASGARKLQRFEIH